MESFNDPGGQDSVTAQLIAVADAITTLTAGIERDATLDAILQLVCEQAVGAIQSADSAAITIVRDGRATVVASTTADFVADHKHASDGGPFFEAAVEDQVVRAGGTDVAARWPTFAARSARSNVSSYLSAPVTIDDSFAGALNLYSYDDHGFGNLDEAVLRVYTTAIVTTINSVRNVAVVRTEIDGLRVAMGNRAVIEQAKGALMALQHISPDAAFAFLSSQSQRTNVKLAVLARRIVDATYT